MAQIQFDFMEQNGLEGLTGPQIRNRRREVLNIETLYREFGLPKGYDAERDARLVRAVRNSGLRVNDNFLDIGDKVTVLRNVLGYKGLNVTGGFCTFERMDLGDNRQKARVSGALRTEYERAVERHEKYKLANKKHKRMRLEELSLVPAVLEPGSLV